MLSYLSVALALSHVICNFNLMYTKLCLGIKFSSEGSFVLLLPHPKPVQTKFAFLVCSQGMRRVQLRQGSEVARLCLERPVNAQDVEVREQGYQRHN